MTSIAELARVTTTCQRDDCDNLFTPTAQQLGSCGGLYCSKMCARLAYKMRASKRKNYACESCLTTDRYVWPQYHLLICAHCRAVAWLSCWRKVPYTGDPGIVAAIDGGYLYPYRCQLCSWWHLTSRTTPVPADFAAQQLNLARLFAERSFDVDRYRTRTFDRFKKS